MKKAAYKEIRKFVRANGLGYAMRFISTEAFHTFNYIKHGKRDELAERQWILGYEGQEFYTRNLKYIIRGV